MPQPPATPTRRVVEGANQRRDDVAGRLDARVEDDDDRRRSRAGSRCSSAAPCPSRSLVRTTSIAGRPAAAEGAASCSADGPSATTTIDVPSGPCARRPASARSRSAGQSVATRTTVATPVAGSSSRDGTASLDPVADAPVVLERRRLRPARGRSRSRDRRSSSRRPRSRPRSRSASAQSRRARAGPLVGGDRTSSGMWRRLAGVGGIVAQNEQNPRP